MLSRTALSVDSKLMPLYSDLRELEGIRKIYQYNATVWDAWAKHIKKGGKVVGVLENSPMELVLAADVFTVIYKRREDLNRKIIKGKYEMSKYIYHFGVGECVCRYIAGSAGSPILGACPGYDWVITDFHPKHKEWITLLKEVGSEWEFDFIEIEQGLPEKQRKEAIYQKLLYIKEKLEKLTGKKITDERLEKQIRLTNEVTELFWRIDELVKAEPHPLKSFDIYNLKVICSDYIGGRVEELLGAMYLLEDELRERVDSGVGYEGKKILLAGGFRSEFLHPIDANGGIVTAAWPFQRFTNHLKKISETKEPLEALAEWYARQPGLGTPEEDAEKFVELVKHYEVDAVIYHRQDPFGNLCTYNSYEAIKEKVDVPFLTVEANEEGAKKIEDFIKSL